MRISLFFLLIYHLLFMGSLHAQHTLKGKVLDAESLEPIPFTNLFIANSTFGTVTNVDGLFELTVPSGNYDLIIQHLGYQTFSFSFSTQMMQEFYEFRMSPKYVELEETKVRDKRGKEWYDNLKLFEKYFLGESINAKRCKILNPEVLVLDMESTPGVLKAYASEMLEIENPNLGYNIKYLLTGFSYDIKGEKVSYSGFPYFIEMDLPKRRMRKIERSRQKAFNGSVTHLIRTLYSGTADDEGFEFYEAVEIPDPEELTNAERGLDIERKINLAKMFQESGREIKLIETFLKIPIPPGEMTATTPDGTRLFIYDKPLYLIYDKESEEPNYSPYNEQNLGIPMDYQLTRMEMVGKAVKIFPSGSFFHPMDMFFQGYMAWEKVGDLLPLDYE